VVKKLDTVILAAGLSSRMGAFKPLLTFKQSTIIETVIDTALAISNRVIVVVGFQATDIVNVKRWDEHVIFIKNEQYEKGMFSSVKVGATLVKSPRFFIALGDQPQIPASVYQQLLSAKSADVVQPAFLGKHGHPILLSENVRQAILAADENDPAINLKTVLEPFRKRLVEVGEPGILVDMDTPEDYNIISRF
jgi:molybdenum cofactor cytidylyltransferase